MDQQAKTEEPSHGSRRRRVVLIIAGAALVVAGVAAMTIKPWSNGEPRRPLTAGEVRASLVRDGLCRDEGVGIKVSGDGREDPATGIAWQVDCHDPHTGIEDIFSLNAAGGALP